ncbi:MAG: hypothetical protein ACOYB3_01760 [Azonexus sp.]
MNEQLPEIAFVTITVTCVTEGCLNQNIPITFDVPRGCRVACGVCGSVLVEENTEVSPWQD